MFAAVRMTGAHNESNASKAEKARIEEQKQSAAERALKNDNQYLQQFKEPKVWEKGDAGSSLEGCKGVIEVTEGNFSSSKSLLGDMDPYVVLEFGDGTIKESTVQKNAGLTPKWN